MKNFAFLINPLTLNQLKEFHPLARMLPEPLVKLYLKIVSGIKVIPLKPIVFSSGEEIQGYFLVPSRIPKHLSETSESEIMDTVTAAAQAAKRLNVEMLGLDGYAAIAADKHNVIVSQLGVPINTGNGFTAWSIIEAIFRECGLKMIDMKKASLTVVDATYPVGSLCAVKCAEFFPKIRLTSERIDPEVIARLEKLRDTIVSAHPIDVAIDSDIHAATRDADMIVTCGYQSVPLKPQDLKKNVVLCDASVYKNLYRQAILAEGTDIIEGRMIKLPFQLSFQENIAPKDIIDSSLAETILLVKEGKPLNFSLGNNVDVDRLEEIGNSAVRNQFKVYLPEAPLV